MMNSLKNFIGGKKKNKTNILPYQHNHESLIGTATVILNFVMDEKNLLNPDFSIDDIGTALNLKKKRSPILFSCHTQHKVHHIKTGVAG